MMRAQTKSVLSKLASLPVVRWEIWRDKRWQKSSAFSATVWAFNFGVLYVGLQTWGHGYWTIIGLNIFWDVVTYSFNKKEVFGDRKVSYASSGSFTFVAGTFFFLSHKAMLLLLAFFGISAIWAQIALAGVGILENPVRFVFNNLYAFSERHQKTKTA